MQCKITKNVEREILNHSLLIHPHVVRFEECFLTPQYPGHSHGVRRRCPLNLGEHSAKRGLHARLRPQAPPVSVKWVNDWEVACGRWHNVQPCHGQVRSAPFPCVIPELCYATCVL